MFPGCLDVLHFICCGIQSSVSHNELLQENSSVLCGDAFDSCSEESRGPFSEAWMLIPGHPQEMWNSGSGTGIS